MDGDVLCAITACRAQIRCRAVLESALALPAGSRIQTANGNIVQHISTKVLIVAGHKDR